MNPNTYQASIKDTSVPVVVLYTYHYGQLGILRTFGRLGINVHGVDPHTSSPGFFSRYCKKKFIWDTDGSPAQNSVDYLLKVAKQIGQRSILIHTTDSSSGWLASNADALSEGFIFPKLTEQIVQQLANKKDMFYLAKKYGIPTPEATFPTTIDQVIEFSNNVTFPVVMKEMYRSGSPKFGKRMFIAHTKNELIELYKRHEDFNDPSFMIQEYIPGEDDTIWMFNGYFNNNSDCLFAITGKKIRQSPIHKGVTSLGICLNNPEVEKLTKHFMKSLGYKGILDIGYRYDKRDGKYKVLDVNPRIGSSFRLFVASNGLDVARAAYLDLTGQKVPKSKQIEGRKWFVEDRDLISIIQYRYEKILTTKQCFTSFQGVQEGAWFAWDDLLPFFIQNIRVSRKVLSKNESGALNPYKITRY